MGNLIPAVDMIVNDFIRPINQAYAFHDYRTASQLAFTLNNFLVVQGLGVKNLPDPTPNKDDFGGELSTDKFFQDWFEEYYDKIIKALGHGIGKRLWNVIEK